MHIPSSLIEKTLRGLDLLRDLTDADLARLVDRLELLSAPAEQGVFREGAEGLGLYIVIEGLVSIRRAMPTGGEHELAVLHPGECFGEMSLLDGAERMASAIVIEDALLARLPRGTFDGLIDEDPVLGSRLLRSMSRVICQRQRELTYVMQDLVDFEREPVSPEEQAMSQMFMRHVTWN